MSIQALSQQHCLPEDTVAELKSAFDLFDQDGDGTIDIDELVNIFEALDVDVKPSKSELRAMVAEVDADGNEELDCKYLYSNIYIKMNSFYIFASRVGN